MTSFVHVDQPAEHRGVNRALKQSAGNTGLTIALVIAAGAFFLAIANPLTTREIDGGWMVAWIAVCAIVFGAIGLSAHKLSPLVARLAERRAIARSDAQLYEYAKYDPRILQELQAAVTRHQVDGDTTALSATRA